MGRGRVGAGERRVLPPHLIREVVAMPDEVSAQRAGAVVRGCRLLLCA